MNQSSPQTFWQARSHTQKNALGALGVLLLGAVIISAMGALKSKPEEVAVPEALPKTVDIVSASPQPLTVKVNSQGMVSPVHRVNLVTEVAGRVITVAEGYADGGFFSESEPLVTVDSRDYRVALRQAESEVAKAEEILAMEKGQARQAKHEWRDRGDVEANALFLREPQLRSAKASLEAAKANREKAKLNIERTGISAPFDGRIITKHVDVGQYVSPGTIVAEVFSTEKVLVRLPLTDRQVAKVALPLTAEKRTDAELPLVKITAVYGQKSYSWFGRIVRTEGTVDVKSRVVYAVAEINAPYLITPDSDKPPLSVGMYVSAEIHGRELSGVTRIPSKALHKNNQLILADSNDEIQFKTVDVVQASEEFILVRGLAEGDRVVISTVPYASAGVKVAPKPIARPGEDVFSDTPSTEISQQPETSKGASDVEEVQPAPHSSMDSHTETNADNSDIKAVDRRHQGSEASANLMVNTSRV